MTNSSRSHHPDTSREVVVGLVNDEMAAQVAEEGVALAGRLAASVRFVQVVPEGLDAGDRADAESATFAAGLTALRHGHHHGATFESPGGDPATVLVERSAKALGLVIGQDRPAEEAPGHGVAEFCRTHARCPVHVVPHPVLSHAAEQDQSHWGTSEPSPNVVDEPLWHRGPEGEHLRSPSPRHLKRSTP